jgi:AcrR family transcriptional regulator
MAPDRRQQTKEALIQAAEELMAARGINAIDLREIQALAGQKNRSAVNYYFDDREGLVRAIGAKHRAMINDERNRMLERLERRHDVCVVRLVEALVLPLAGSLGTPSGRNYIIILAEAASRLGTSGLLHPQQAHTDSVQKLNAMLMSVLPGPSAQRQARIGHAVLTVPVLLADVARDINRHALSVNQGKRRVRFVTAFVSGALAAGTKDGLSP